MTAPVRARSRATTAGVQVTSRCERALTGLALWAFLSLVLGACGLAVSGAIPTLGNPDAYQRFVAEQPVQFTGFKLFYEQDVPLMSPIEVLGLRPAPLLVIYQ
ncbi:MAG: hypothetical protein WEG36_07555 [Gemmatimonadota bacterium]